MSQGLERKSHIELVYEGFDSLLVAGQVLRLVGHISWWDKT